MEAAFPADGPEGLKAWEPLEFGPQHMQMIMMRAAGMRPGEIAALMGYSASRVSTILGDPRAKVIMSQLAGRVQREFLRDVQSAIHSYAAEAVETIATLMRHAESEPVRLGAAKDMADRAGFKPREVVMHANVNIDSDDARRILEAIHEARQPEPELEFIQDSAEIFQPPPSLLPGVEAAQSAKEPAEDD